MGCMICGNRGSGAVCPRCGYDESQDREQYPTLADDGKRPPANMALRDAFVTSLIEQIAAAKLAAVQTPARLQATQIDHASNILERGSCGAELTWELNDNGVLMFLGNGKMDDYFFRSPPWNKKKATIEEVKFPKGLTSIGEFAFSDFELLTNVIIPDGVRSIGASAFIHCTALKRVTIPDSVISIGYWAFSRCPNLIMYGAEGSFAEAYSKKNGIAFANR